MGLFDRVTERLDGVVDMRAASEAAVEIAAKLRSDATTARGNVPQFAPGANGHPGGNVPIAATYSGRTIYVSGPDWVMRKAVEKGQVEEWEAIVRESISRKRR